MPFLHLMGAVVGGPVLLRAARAAAAQMAAGNNDPYWTTKIALARFYAAHVLPQAAAYRTAVILGGDQVFALDEALL